jgi:hypothetical protein
MRKLLSIFIVFLSTISFGQSNPTLLFNYDTTKIYIKYLDLKPFITKENAKLNDLSILNIKNDTIEINEYLFDIYQQSDTLTLKLNKELFAAINNKNGTIIFKGQVVSSFYTKKVKDKRNGQIYFKGIDYYDTISKTHFLTETLYQKWYCIGNPSF